MYLGVCSSGAETMRCVSYRISSVLYITALVLFITPLYIYGYNLYDTQLKDIKRKYRVTALRAH